MRCLQRSAKAKALYKIIYSHGNIILQCVNEIQQQRQAQGKDCSIVVLQASLPN
jgi:hypothetical protein